MGVKLSHIKGRAYIDDVEGECLDLRGMKWLEKTV
jgi:hypothetical protein